LENSLIFNVVEVNCSSIFSSFLNNLLVGKVYLSKDVNDGKQYALKFFGYVDDMLPPAQAVQNEISLMTALKGIPNVVQIEGIFDDSLGGYVPDKKFPHAYPVIVMEALKGGDLFSKIQKHSRFVTERYLSNAFKGVVVALHEMHQRGYVHRDLKLENLMYTTPNLESPIKVSFFIVVFHSIDSIDVCYLLSLCLGY
jgi:serine/threonine protein kinase